MRTRMLVTVALTTLVGVAASSPAHAVLEQAAGGFGWPRVPSTGVGGEDCFDSGFAMVSNIGVIRGIPGCGSTAIRWIMPLTIAASGNKSVSVRAKGGSIVSGIGANAVSCTLIAVNSTNAGTAGSTGSTSGSTPQWSTFSTAVFVPANSTAAVECLLTPPLVSQFEIGVASISYTP